MTILKLVFWISAGIVFYTYIGYGVLLFILVKIKYLFSHGTKQPQTTYQPHVALIISAYNEEEFIETKIINTLELDYPADKLDILIITDGSNDNTTSIVKKYSQVQLLHQPERRGKAAAM